MDMVIKKFDVFWVDLDPTVGREIKKIRPAVIISPDSINKNLDTVLIAPMTSTIRNYPTRITVSFQGKNGSIALDQIRCIDKKRLKNKMGSLKLKATHNDISNKLVEMFKN
jgi:mRNA interferase MazF